ncbi:MAG: FtsX-like permease family protein [Euryarchaeota archaeon]|nr:FtsX-like permease family protein [Euryarchaeota archaeon]
MLRFLIKNIRSHTVDFLFGSSGIAIAILFYLLLSSSFFAMVEKSLSVQRSSVLSDIVVMGDLTDEDIENIGTIGGVEGTYPAVLLRAGFINGEKTLMGIAQKNPVFDIEVVEGAFPIEDRILVPQSIKKDLDLSIGKKLKFSIFLENEQKVHSFDISGFYNDSKTDYFFIPVETAQKIRDYNVLFVFLKPNASIDAVKSKIKEINSNLQLVTYDMLFENMKENYELTGMATQSATFMIFFATGINILIVSLILVKKRKKEIGILKAIGFTSMNITKLFLVESIAMMCLGYGMGAFGSLLLLWYLKIPIIGEIFIQALKLLLILGLIFSLYPLLKAKTTSVMECFRDKPLVEKK